MRRWLVPIVVVAATLLLAGCTAQDVESAVNQTLAEESSNVSATIDRCYQEGPITRCKVETTNRRSGATRVRVGIAVSREGSTVRTASTEERIDAGRDYVDVIFDREPGNYSVSIEELLEHRERRRP